MTANEALGKRLRLLRSELGLSQRQIAQQLGCERSTYSYYELGKTEPSFERLAVIAGIFGISLDSLIVDSRESKDHCAEAVSIFELEKFCDLSCDEKELILCFRRPNYVQQKSLLEKISDL